LEKEITFRPYQRLAIMYFAEGKYRQAHQKSQKAIQVSKKDPDAFDVYLAAFARDGRWLRSLRDRMESTWPPERIRYISAAILWADGQYDALVAFSEEDLSDDASAGFQIESKWQAWTLLLRARALTLQNRHKEAAAAIDCIVAWGFAMTESDRTGFIEHYSLYVVYTIADTYYRAGRKEYAKKLIPVLLPALENYGVSWESQLQSIRAMAIDLDCLPPAKVG
jgi:tetratricopeptide (TPR) repeat protein